MMQSRSGYTAQQLFIESMAQAGWTRNEGERRLLYVWSGSDGDADTTNILHNTKPEYEPPWPLSSLFGDISVYTTLNAHLLQGTHVATLLRRTRDRPKRYKSTSVLALRTRKIECFRHELAFVVDALNAYYQYYIEQ